MVSPTWPCTAFPIPTQHRMLYGMDEPFRRLSISPRAIRALEQVPQLSMARNRGRNGQHDRGRFEAFRVARRAEISEREAAATIRQIVMEGSALATCGAGLDVRHLLCGFDSCYLTIRHLPHGTTHPEIEELFTQYGIDTSLFGVVLRRRRQAGDEVEAKVLIDADIGQAVAAGLSGISFKGSILDVALDEGGVPNKMGSTPEGANNVLTIAWRQPSSTMVVDYGNAVAASNALDMLDNTVIGGRRIRAELKRIPGGTRDIDGFNTCVKISGLPVSVAQIEVETHVGAPVIRAIRPQSIFDTKDVERDLRRHLGLIVPFETFESGLPDPDSVEVHARFRVWDDAKKVHDLLQGTRLKPSYPTFYCRLPKPIQYVITIPLAQYQAQKGRWDSMAEGDTDTPAFIKIINNGIDRASIRVVGDDKKAVGQLKVRVENLVAGEALDGKLWHPTFMGISGRLLLDNISSLTGAYLRGDWKTKTLRLYADGDIKPAVVERLENEIKRLESSEWPIHIPHRAIGFFMRKGLPTLKEELGEDAVTFELAPAPLLFVRGSGEARLIVKRLIQEFRAGMGSEARPDEGDACPICFDEISNPVPLSCAHRYCAACFRHFLASAAEGKTFPLVCTGDEGKCRAPIAIPTIRRSLLPQQFDQLVEAAVTTYIEKQPNKFKYCTTPDCPQVYRCERGSTSTITCPSCFVTVCTACHKEAHEGMTCTERGNIGSQGEQELTEEWAEAADLKRCPSCRVWIQKSEGCNHMACHCGAHICWRCLVSFPDADGIYGHLREVHGGIYDDNVLQEHAARIQDDFEFAQRLQQELDGADT